MRMKLEQKHARIIFMFICHSRILFLSSSFVGKYIKKSEKRKEYKISVDKNVLRTTPNPFLLFKQVRWTRANNVNSSPPSSRFEYEQSKKFVFFTLAHFIPFITLSSSLSFLPFFSASLYFNFFLLFHSR